LNLYHRFDGDEAAPVLVLANSLAATLEMWDAQVPALTDRFRVLRYDHPGHGYSGVGQIDGIESLARGVIELLDGLELDRASFCGVSIGGAVGMRLALDAPTRFDRLVLACTSARFGPPEFWQERADLVRAEGVAAVADVVLERWFTPDYADVQRFREMFLATDAVAYAQCCEAIRDWDARDALHAVRSPTLVISAADDPSTPPEHQALIAEAIPGARLETIPGARHLANAEFPDAFNELVLSFL
jgi:3-oxoadipate enol-lactonase